MFFCHEKPCKDNTFCWIKFTPPRFLTIVNTKNRYRKQEKGIVLLPAAAKEAANCHLQLTSVSFAVDTCFICS